MNQHDLQYPQTGALGKSAKSGIGDCEGQYVNDPAQPTGDP